MPSQLTNLALLAMASSAAAFPFKPNGGYAYPTGSSAFFPIHNGTRPHGTAPSTGYPTTLPVETPAETVVEAGVSTYQTTIVSEYQTVVETRVLTIYPVEAPGTATASVIAGVSTQPAASYGSGSSNSGSGSGSGSGSAASGVCSSRSTSTTTVTEKVTVTVQPGSGSTPSAASSVAAGAASSTKQKVCTRITTPLPSSLIAIATTATPAPVSSAAASSTVELDISSFSLFSTVESSAAASSSAAAVSSYAPASSSAAASSYVEEPVYSSTAAAVSSAVAYTSASAAAAATSSAASYSSSGAKRGVAYNDASLTNVFVGNSKFSWGYNWGQVSAGLSSTFEYVPMIWGTGSDFTTNWFTNAKTAIANGATHILAFNEPDHSEQANLSPADAATGYLTYVEPFKTSNPDVKLGSPAVTNGGDGMGLDWLSSFMTACSSCTIDFVAIHWYDAATNIEYFKSHVESAYKQTGKPLWLTEFGATGSDEEIATFISEAVAWLDSQDYVERYAYFMVKTGSLVSSSDSLSSYGSTYASA